MTQLLKSGVLSAACPTPFDESMLWQHRDPEEREVLRQSLQRAFHNITRLVKEGECGVVATGLQQGQDVSSGLEQDVPKHHSPGLFWHAPSRCPSLLKLALPSSPP